MDTLPILAFWCGAVYCVLRGPVAIIYLLFICLPFGAFAVVPPAMSAGMTLTPAPMAGLLLIARVFTSLKGLDYLFSLIMKPQRLTMLLGFWLAAGSRGEGLVAEAIEGLLDFAFTFTGVREIGATVRSAMIESGASSTTRSAGLPTAMP